MDNSIESRYLLDARSIFLVVSCHDEVIYPAISGDCYPQKVAAYRRCEVRGQRGRPGPEPGSAVVEAKAKANAAVDFQL